ncbi:PREDICTED: uncharacterized protein LOC104609704 [Nelumbo nucifera]|uniref:Uncharacterized protein LOC104609704 n=1 Tax=Nelumbo nucifera TaxID=4432 RepID=A0A1U8B4Q6_NELNU|nr:PREDICTED: uncharacterized protein LOC104609704 [Nelumbo nucifera]
MNDGKKVIGRYEVDNHWVVPYNELLRKYNAHINVEIVAYFYIVKYLYKYIHKGFDKASIVIYNQQDNVQSEVIDKIQQYLDCRYISSFEACWRIYEFPLQQRNPLVERLQYHLENQQVVFDDRDNIANIVSRVTEQRTMLTAWFETNAIYAKVRSLTYVEFPTQLVWIDSRKIWIRRKRGKSIRRLYYAHPTFGERYYHHMLLCIVHGPTSFTELCTIDEIIHDTNKAACIDFGLLDDDNE